MKQAVDTSNLAGALPLTGDDRHIEISDLHAPLLVGTRFPKPKAWSYFKKVAAKDLDMQVTS